MRNIAPAVKIIDEVNFHMPVLHKLDNGIAAFFVKGGSFEIVKVELLFKSGSYHQDKPLQAYATANLLKQGTANRTSEEINKLWDYYGVSLQIEAQKDIIAVGFFCLTRHLDPVLELLLEIVSQAIFPKDEIESLLRNKLQKHIINKQKVQHLARVHFNEVLFGADHPYGKKLCEEDFDHLYRDDLIAYHNKYLHPTNCLCLVSGNFPDGILELINTKFSMFSWPQRPSLIETAIRHPSGVTDKQFISRPDAVQASVRIGKLMPGRSHPDYHKVAITNTLLGGFFGSRLMRNIRQEKGYTYGIHSAVVALLQETYFFISTQVGTDVREAAVHEIYNELKDLRNRPATPSELQILKNYLSAGFLRSFDGPFMQMEKFREILLFNLDYSHYESFLPLLNDIRASDIQDTAAKYFHEDNMLEVIVGQQ